MVMRDQKTRLGRLDWVLAGFRALTEAGPQGLRVELIARALGASKGSFYWHFKDLQALREAMLQTWEDLATTAITAAVRGSGLHGRDQLMLLVEKVSVVPDAAVGGLAVEPAIRDWGRTDPLARSVLERVDAQRLHDLRGFLGEAGLSEPEATTGAVRLYAAVIGLESLRMTCGVEMAPALRLVATSVLDGAG
jgi:AcrR family transcriptional regulator